MNFRFVDATDRFLDALAGVIDPEQKRKVIGEMFIDVFRDEVARMGEFAFLAQGTLYPDVIESHSAHGGPSATIKSHHNVGGLPEDLELRPGRAAARPVQGRGARARPRAGPAGRRSSSASPSRAPAWPCASSAR